MFRYTAEGNFVELRKAIRSGSDVNQTLKVSCSHFDKINESKF